jgi:hypothetical protein
VGISPSTLVRLAGLLFFGALVAYDATINLLHRRGSQQAFNTIRYLHEKPGIDPLAKRT